MEGKQTLKFATFTGQPVKFLTPRNTEIIWDDIGFALGNECRFNGHVPWTVLQHTGLVIKLAQSSGYTKEEIAYTAAHDLHEAYVSDMVGPMKEVLTEWKRIEERWEKHVHTSLGLEWPVPAEIKEKVKHCDNRALVIEAKRADYCLADHIEKKFGRVTAAEVRLVDFVTTLNAQDLLSLIRLTLAANGNGLSADGDLAPRQCRWTKPFNYTVTSSNGITQYVVRWDGGNDWACTCPQFVHRNKVCKHINEIQSTQCDWRQDNHGGAALAPKFQCPKCGEGTVPL